MQTKSVCLGSLIWVLMQFQSLAQTRVPDAYIAIKNNQCVKAIKKVEDEINRRHKNVLVASIEFEKQKFDIKSESYIQPPIPTRAAVITYFLDSKSELELSSFFQNDLTAKNYSSQIMQQCRIVGAVGFWQHEFGVRWSMTPQKTLIKDRCMSRGEALQEGMNWYDWICN